MAQKTWQDKAHKLIAEMCLQSYRQQNPDRKGKSILQHKPYSVPALAQVLIACLDTDNEEAAKHVFLNYDNYADEYKQ